MPFVKVYIHFVWSTKNRVQTLNTPEIRQKVWQHIRENAIKKGIFIDFVNGYCRTLSLSYFIGYRSNHFKGDAADKRRIRFLV